MFITIHMTAVVITIITGTT